jgi:hypothetical protein
MTPVGSKPSLGEGATSYLDPFRPMSNQIRTPLNGAERNPLSSAGWEDGQGASAIR